MEERRVARHLRVHGHVQGVFFRATTRQRAQQAGVAGWVRNDPDGTVEMLLEGAPGAVDAVESWVRSGGPRSARVESVEAVDREPEGHDEFAIRR
jgi:acylphosphatase